MFLFCITHVYIFVLQSFPKIGKFRTKGFPHFDVLGELYDGQIAEGTYNFTSTQRAQQPPPVQVEIDPEVSSVEVTHSHSHIGETSVDDPDGTQGGMQEANLQSNSAGPSVAAQTRPAVAAAPEPKRRRTTGDVAAVMERYIEMKTLQIEEAKAESKNLDEFSIKKCIARLDTMEVTKEEKVKALGVFKNADNRELFMCADLEVALMWLRIEMK